MSPRTLRTALAALLVLSLAGTTAADIKTGIAGDQTPPEKQKPAETGTVQGKVNYKGAPVVALHINFHPAKGEKVHSAPIEPDGTYTVKDVPPGKYDISLTAQPPKAKDDANPPKGQNVAKDELPPPPGKQAAKPTPLPAKYADPKTSGLTFEVKAGKQTFDIELK